MDHNKDAEGADSGTWCHIAGTNDRSRGALFPQLGQHQLDPLAHDLRLGWGCWWPFARPPPGYTSQLLYQRLLQPVRDRNKLGRFVIDRHANTCTAYVVARRKHISWKTWAAS